MALDKNPRHFFIDATDLAANVDADADQDFVTIEFAGRVTPTVRARLIKAFEASRFEIIEKRIA